MRKADDRSGRSRYRVKDGCYQGFRCSRTFNFEPSRESAQCHVHKGLQSRVVVLDDTDHLRRDRPSTQEIYTMARLIRSEMPEDNCDFNFPVYTSFDSFIGSLD